jgi:TPR repeat protein
MMKTLFSALCAFVLAFAAQASGKSSDAIVKLLNSRASGSRSEFREAAKIVAEDAKEGRPLQQFVIALVTHDRDLPRKLRLKPETRKEYLDQARDKIRRLAEEKNNALAWYLLSLETNNMSFLKRAADGENVQALNAWGTITLTDALRNPSMDTNDVERVLVKCFGIFKKAADAGDANGLYNLGMCHLRGLGTPQDDQSAFNCFRSAAEKEHPEAINNIGLFFREGRVVDKDLELSTKWFEKSASYDNAYGQFNNIRYHHSSSHGYLNDWFINTSIGFRF